MGEIVHTPVLLEEVITWLAPRDDDWLVDGTLGEGGHSEALLSRFPRTRVVGIDQDPEIGKKAQARLARYGGRFRYFCGNFSRIREAVPVGEGRIGGVLLDLGISSFHYEESGRGFSFLRDEPLDMRLSPDRTTSAADVVNGYEERALARVLQEYGEEPFAFRIAQRILAARQEKRIERSLELAALVEAAIPAGKRPRTIHPATRTFQALRIEVNRELEVLGEALAGALDVLGPGGRLAVISFHSLEDRIVKHFFRENAPHCRCPERAPLCTCGRPGRLRILTGKPVTAGAGECGANPRARSAKLRVAERLEETDA